MQGGKALKGRRALAGRQRRATKRRGGPVKTIFRITVLPAGIVYGQPIRSNETQSVAENNRGFQQRAGATDVPRDGIEYLTSRFVGFRNPL